MAIESEKYKIRAWLLIRSDVINDKNWQAITRDILDIKVAGCGVIRADWVSGTYNLVVPVVAMNEDVLKQLTDQIEDLEINPKVVHSLEPGVVQGHNPPPGAYDPDRHNEWG